DKISKESSKAIAAGSKTDDPHAATKAEETVEEKIIATQVEAKSDTVTFKKTPKKKKKKEATDETTDIPKDDA
ncbi:hypothetical protein ACFLRS_01995, partial [Campylobacterota bacterium]